MRRSSILATFVCSTAFLACGGQPIAGGDAGVHADAPVVDSAHSLDGAADARADVSGRDAIIDAPSAMDVVPGSDATTTDTTPLCGTCATGFACSPSGYCVSPNGVPQFGHVYLIMMENHSLGSILGSAAAPYINGLMTTWSYATNYVTRASSVIHPSCPNYIAVTAGDTFGIDCDCSPATASLTAHASCLTASTDSSCPQAHTHIGDSFDTAGVPWREYGEGMGSACNTSDNGNYVSRHIPFLYYNNVRADATRCALRVRDFGDFATDLAAGTFRFSMISPNLCNDMHGNGVLGAFDSCGGTSAVNNGDNWLSMHVPAILARPGFQTNGTDVLFIVWDEEDGSTGNAAIPLIVISPLVRAMSTTSLAYDHYSLLGTIAEGLGAARVGSTEALAAPAIHDIWR